MKNIIFLIMAVFLWGGSISAQVHCEQWDPNLPDKMPQKEFFGNKNECAEGISFDQYDLIAPVTIYVNIHFHQDAGPGIGVQEGIDFANELLLETNQTLNNLAPNANPGPGGQFAAHVPASKYNLKLFTDPENVNDIHGGIWFHPDQNADAGVYNDRVIDIHLRDNANASCGQGWSCTGCDVTILRHTNCLNAPWMSILLNHEMAHSLDLDHVSWCNNQCNMIDIDPEQECQPNCPDIVTCDGFNPGSSPCNPDLCEVECNNQGNFNNCQWNVSNNLTAQGAEGNAMTPCQWEVVFNRFLNTDTDAYSWADNCTDVGPPLTIPTGANELWDRLVLLNRDVVVEAGATLTITCEVRMGTDRSFTVKRGGKLIIDGGTITNLCDDLWKGIYVWGNANKPQPDPLGVQQLDDAGILMIQGNSLIEHSKFVFQANAKGIPYPEQVDRWGGLIIAENSDFYNNRIVGGFMKYDYENKSRFYKCHFAENGDFSNGTAGVTIWACNGITFEENIFENLDDFGIYGIDHSIVVINNNSFLNNGVGIESKATYPFSTATQIGLAGTVPNYFINNNTHVHAYATDSHEGLNIYGNEFFDAEVGVSIFGPTHYNIKSNFFYNQGIGVLSTESNDYTNFIDCNYIQNVEYGIIARGNNKLTQIRGNDFEQSSYNITLENYQDTPGRIRGNQGAPFSPAWNCFSPNHLADIFTLGNTVSFNYFIPSEDVGSCDPFPTTPGNYGVTPTSPKNDICNPEGGGGGHGGGSEKDVNAGLGKKIYDLISKREFDKAEDILANKRTYKSQKWLYAIRLMQGKFVEAKKVLDQLPVQTEDQQWFKEIQLINLEFRSSREVFLLSSSQDAFLHRVANSDSPTKGYAQGLLYLLKNERFDFTFDLPKGLTEEAVIKTNSDDAALAQFEVKPNPVVDNFILTYPSFDNQTMTLELYDVQGRRILTQELDGSGSQNVATDEMTEGVYFINVSGDSGLLFKTKIVVLK